MSARRINFSAVLLAAIMLIVASGALFVYLAATSRFNFLKKEGTGNNIQSILFVIEYAGKPIASYVTLYYPVTRRASVIDVPGDIGRIIKQINRVDRIDSVYDSQHVPVYAGEIQTLLAIDLNYTIILDIEALGKIVDLLDGVRIFIPAAIEIYHGEETILFPSGWATLDGDKARSYLLYDGGRDDVESSERRRQRFFTGFIKKLGEKNEYLNKTDVDRFLYAFFRGNINRRSLAKLLAEWSRIDTDRLNVQTIAGNYRDVSGQTLLIPYYDGNLIKDIVRQIQTVLTRQGSTALGDRVITVEVLNGTTTAGLAGRTAELIRGFGYDVINVSNADRNDYEKTEVIDRLDHSQETTAFTSIIHCDNVTVDLSNQDINAALPNYEYKADFTLIIGKDYNGRFN